jgi:hypothetical protein
MQLPGAVLSPLQLAPGGEGATNALSAPAAVGAGAYNLGERGVHSGLQALGVPDVHLSDIARNTVTGQPFTPQDDQENLTPLNSLGANAAGALASKGAYDVTAAVGRGVANLPTTIPAMRQKAADILSEGSMKIPPTVGTRARNGIVETTQKYGITPTKKGVEKLDAAVNNLSAIQKTMEDNARAGGDVSVPTADVLKSLDDVRAEWSKGDTPRDFVNVIDQYRNDVLSQKKSTLSMDDMIALKRNIQEQLRPLYDKAMKINPGLKETIKEQAKSAVENDLRKRLEDIIPEYKDVNSELHKMIDTRPYLNRAMNRISNYNLVNLRDAAAAGLGGLAHGTVGAITAMVLEKILSDPRVWAHVANKLSTKVPPTFSAEPSTTYVAPPPQQIGDYSVEFVPEHHGP